MKIALISANIGDIDDVIDVPEQTVPFDRFVFTDKNLPHDLPNLDNRTKARYLKTMPHRYLKGYDFYIWLDGRVQVTSEKFIESYIKMLHDNDFVITFHGYRKNVYDELKFILHEMNKGNHYLVDRYGKQNLRRELDFFYKEDFPKQIPLFSSGMFGRKNNEYLNAACEDWFFKCLEYTNFDQAMLSYIIYKHELSYDGFTYENEFYKVLKHKPHDTY